MSDCTLVLQDQGIVGLGVDERGLSMGAPIHPPLVRHKAQESDPEPDREQEPVADCVTQAAVACVVVRERGVDRFARVVL